ncbi:MAG: type II secretion system major pseudopilin GspG [Pseudomonadota bacterium]
MRNLQARKQSGFTLIEIMVVVVIIGILATLIGPKIFGQIGTAQKVKARSDIRSIESSLKLFRLDNFRYPTTEMGLDALVNNPNDPSIKNWAPGGYMDRLPLDPWENPYRYLSPGNNGEIDVYSLGADGREGGEGDDADIGNWSLDQ